MKRIAALSVILTDPARQQVDFNSIVSDFQDIVKGRLGIPFDDEKVAAICIIASAEQEKIDLFTEKLNSIDGVTVNTVLH